MLAKMLPREVHADVNAGYSLVECLREMEKRRLGKVSAEKC